MTKSRHLLVGATCGRQPGVGNKYRIVEHYTTGGVWPTCGHPTAGSPKYRSKYEWATSIRVLGIRTGRSKTTILVGMPVELWYKNWRAVEDRPYNCLDICLEMRILVRSIKVLHPAQGVLIYLAVRVRSLFMRLVSWKEKMSKVPGSTTNMPVSPA